MNDDLRMRLGTGVGIVGMIVIAVVYAFGGGRS